MTSVRIRWVFLFVMGLAAMLTGCAAIDQARSTDERDSPFTSPATDVDAPPSVHQTP